MSKEKVKDILAITIVTILLTLSAVAWIKLFVSEPKAIAVTVIILLGFWSAIRIGKITARK